MKKYIVLSVLFVLPLVVYLFFASGVNNFAKLPIVTNTVVDVAEFSDEQFKGKITIVGFLGTDVYLKKGNALNLNQKIYKRFHGFEDFQFLMVQPQGTEKECQQLVDELSRSTQVDTKGWKFVFLDPVQIQLVFDRLNTPLSLDENLGSPYVFIIDKGVALRGRDDNDNVGYDARSVADIHNNMVDDVKVILAEYRLALKKYNADRKI
ncbi:MAG: hypothetical protein MKZ61_04595 [Flavobacteriales bacterium]|nr:hypothetical protein [Flavobacteriales bacterium]